MLQLHNSFLIINSNMMEAVLSGDIFLFNIGFTKVHKQFTCPEWWENG